MKHFLVSSLVAGAVLSFVMVGPVGGSAAARHLPITSPAPPRTAVHHAAVNPSPAPRLRMAVRHIPINHSPAPPLSTIEISKGNPTPTIVPPTPPTVSACAGCPQNAQANCVACPPQGQTVQLNLVQLPL
jgi:hypothetical protein